MEHKGIEYELVELPTGLHPFLLPLRGFRSNPAAFRQVDDDRPHRMLRMIDRLGTVPSLLIDGQRVKTNREIARFLETFRPDPPLFPLTRSIVARSRMQSDGATRSFRWWRGELLSARYGAAAMHW